MDSIAGFDIIEPLEVRSECLTAYVGEKRAVENRESDARSLKKAKNGEAANMKKVAEIVLVLATMGKMSGGRTPTLAEIEMMGDAKAKLAVVCQGLAPKDVFPRHVFGPVIEDLGLSKSREQRLGFRPLKISIAEKLKLTKKKMEKSEEFALHSSSYSSQRLHTNVGSAAESCGTSHAVRMFSSEKPSQPPSSSGGFQPSLHLGHVSTAKSTPLLYQLPTSEVRRLVSSGLPRSNLGRDSSSLALPRAERHHFRLDGNTNGASYTSQVQVNSSGDDTRTPTWSMLRKSPSSVKTMLHNKIPVQANLKVEGAADMSRVGRVDPQATTSKPFISPTTSVNPPTNNHNEIGKIVQKLLQPHLLEHPVWTPPSRDYMSKALACHMCKFIINEVDNVLVCDACEKGDHLKCLQFLNQKLVSGSDWHCGKCLSLNNGKPLTPKYGCIMKNLTASKVFSDATAVQLALENIVGTSDGKFNLQKIIANGNSGILNVPTGTINSKCSHFAAAVEMADKKVMQGNGTLSSKDNKVEEHPSRSCPNNLIETSADLIVERSYEEKLDADSKSQPKANYETVINILDHSQAFEHPQENDQTNKPKSSGNASLISPETNLKPKELEKLCGQEFVEHNANDKTNHDKQGVSLANHVETTEMSIRPREHCGSLSGGLCDVDWIGDALQVVDEKTYYQSCSISGVVYKIHDHALFRSNNNILIPCKIQGMWEDSKTRSKWVVASSCYFPANLPEAVGRPCAPEINEVYESNHDIAVRAGLIEGPCKVVPPRTFEERERISRLRKEETDGLHPLFICKWFYDEPKGLFRTITSC